MSWEDADVLISGGGQREWCIGGLSSRVPSMPCESFALLSGLLLAQATIIAAIVLVQISAVQDFPGVALVLPCTDLLESSS